MKLLNDLINFGKAFGRLTQVAQLGVVIALIFVAFSMGNCKGKTELDTFLVQYEELQQNAKKTTEYANSLNTQVAQLSDSAKQQDEKIKKLTISISFRQQQRVAQVEELAQLEGRVAAARANSNTEALVETQEAVIDNLKTQVETTEAIVTDQQQVIQAQATQVLALQQAVQLATARGDTLQTILNGLPKKPANPDRFFFGLLPKPSRTVVGVIALAGGIVIGSQVGR